MSLKEAQITKLLDSLEQLHRLLLKQDATALELFRHPDATANQVMQAQQAMASNCAFYRKAYKQVGEAFGPSVSIWDKNYPRWQRLRY